jgi:hypothetical protein
MGKSEQVRFDKEDVLSAIAALDGEILVTLPMSAEAWPNEYGQQLKQSEGATTTIADVDTTTEQSNSCKIPELADLAVKPAVERGLKLEDTTVLEDLLWMPGKPEAIAEILSAQRPFPDSGLALLAKVIGPGVETQKTVNLSSYDLSGQQIITIASQFKDAEVLRLSHNKGITVDVLDNILPSLPNLRRLVLLGTLITDDEVCNLLAKQTALCPNIQAIKHPSFLKAGEENYPNGFSIIVMSVDHRIVSGASIPWLNPPQIIQNVTDYLAPFSPDDPFGASSLLQSAIVLQAALGCELRNVGQAWGSRGVLLFPQFSLCGFRGEGWLFAFQTSSYGDALTGQNLNKYAFVRVNVDVFRYGC